MDQAVVAVIIGPVQVSLDKAKFLVRAIPQVGARFRILDRIRVGHADPGRLLVAQRHQIIVSIQRMPHPGHACPPTDIVQAAQYVSCVSFQIGMAAGDSVGCFRYMQRMRHPGAGVERLGLVQQRLAFLS